MKLKDCEYRVHIVIEGHGPKGCMLYRFEDDGQGVFVGECEFGPFDTIADVWRWLCRTGTLDGRAQEA